MEQPSGFPGEGEGGVIIVALLLFVWNSLQGSLVREKAVEQILGVMREAPSQQVGARTCC